MERQQEIEKLKRFSDLCTRLKIVVHMRSSGCMEDSDRIAQLIRTTCLELLIKYDAFKDIEEEKR